MSPAHPPGALDRPVAARAFVVTVAALAAVAAVAPGFRRMHREDPVYPGPGVTRVLPLSAYHPGLRETAGDTPVFEMRGGRPGGTVLVLGGTHADEPAGYVAAVLLVECARVDSGRLLVVPRANASGFTHNYAQEGHPSFFEVATPGGSRRFTYGARATNPVHQWPDPQVYTLAGSGQSLSGSETRNLNRAYPGKADGSLTERIAFAITSLIRRESVVLALDLHEASPEYPVVNTMVAHQRALELAAIANMRLEAEGIAIGLEPSPENLHGLSHREWGDTTTALAVLMETTNPAQGRLRGRTGAQLVVTGRDRFYSAASARGRLSVPFPDAGWPLSVRVARHVAGFSALAGALGDLAPDRAIALSGLPDYASIVERGVGAFLRPPTRKGPGLP
jgi:hypothetical protein